VKRREAKRKGEKERYKHLNAEFQRITRRDKKAFLSDQCKEIEENNRMGKTRDLFKKIRDTKGTFHAHTPGAKERGYATPKLSFQPSPALSDGGKITPSILHSGMQFYTEFGEEGWVIKGF